MEALARDARDLAVGIGKTSAELQCMARTLTLCDPQTVARLASHEMLRAFLVLAGAPDTSEELFVELAPAVVALVTDERGAVAAVSVYWRVLQMMGYTRISLVAATATVLAAALRHGATLPSGVARVLLKLLPAADLPNWNEEMGAIVALIADMAAHQPHAILLTAWGAVPVLTALLESRAAHLTTCFVNIITAFVRLVVTHRVAVLEDLEAHGTLAIFRDCRHDTRVGEGVEMMLQVLACE